MDPATLLRLHKWWSHHDGLLFTEFLGNYIAEKELRIIEVSDEPTDLQIAIREAKEARDFLDFFIKSKTALDQVMARNHENPIKFVRLEVKVIA